jgi:hypothetical protein
MGYKNQKLGNFGGIKLEKSCPKDIHLHEKNPSKKKYQNTKENAYFFS